LLAVFNNNENTVSVLNFSEINARLSALSEIRKNPDFQAITVAVKRVSNILKKNGKGSTFIVNEKLFDSPVEKELYAELAKVSSIEKDIAKNPTVDNFKLALNSVVALKPVIDNFFDNIMVMVDNNEVKKNRLNLLNNLKGFVCLIGDLNHLQ
jgi:glycyl-tRNA synthetase beta chain